MFELFLVAYPWDVPVEHLGEELDRLRGEVGVTGLSLWVAAPPATQFRAVGLNPRVLHTRGGVLFQPTERHYAQTRCQPVVSSWSTAGNPLARISKACAAHGMRLRVMVSASATGRMAERYPEFTCRNAFGDESQTRLCLANPEVQSYLRGMVMDLSSDDGVCALTLADFDIDWSDAEVEKLQTAFVGGPIERSLLATCFCGSCRERAQSAGVDAEAARQTAEGLLQEAMEHGHRQDGSLEDCFAEHPGLGEYRRRQTEELNSLLRKTKEACRCELLLERRADRSGEDAAGGLDLSIPDAVITCVDDLDELSRAAPPGARRNEVRLPAASAVGAVGDRLVGVLPEAVQAGFAALEIDNYGLLPRAALATLKRAIRFARRTAAP
jgi:hypothetical protein